MSDFYDPRRLTPAQIHQLHAQARARASQLRREQIQALGLWFDGWAARVYQAIARRWVAGRPGVREA